MHGFRRLGLQRRIMLYVTVGLTVMFGVVALLGLDAIGEATELVYRERLTTAHTTAGTIVREFAHVAAEVDEAGRDLFPRPASGAPAGAAARLLARLERSPELYRFLRVSGVWLLDGSGRLREQAGEPRTEVGSASLSRADLDLSPEDRFSVIGGVGTVAGDPTFAVVVVRAGDSPDDTELIVAVHAVAINSVQPFLPAADDDSIGQATVSPPPAGLAAEYHLEIVGPDGTVLLGIGPDEYPGQASPHYSAIRDLARTRGAATLRHDPANGEPHVMAVVPLGRSPFYLVLEQAVDVALALPLQLRDQLFLWIGIGFAVTLAVAWITTRRVVAPTEMLTRAAERMAEGDLASPIEVNAQDEVAQLADSLEAMRRRLQAALAAIEQTNVELETRVADRTARLGQVLRTTISAQEEERHRLARELHDETAQALAALAIALDRARDGLSEDGSSPEPRERITEARAIAARLLEETRRLILGLRPSVLDDLGLVAAIRWLCETALDDHGVEATIMADDAGARFPSHVEVALFRIAQEAIGNVSRHAAASKVRITLEVADGVARLTVVDDGRGFDPAQVFGPAGIAHSVGLLGMQERVRLLEGKMEVHSEGGHGTEVVVELPVVPEAA
jgi:two-component system sensor histidine kinase UhpB